MIYRVIESKIAFTITVCGFVFALMWNASQDAGVSLAGHGMLAPAVIAHGPTLPPDPWAGSESLVAHGPTLPPDPWAGSKSLVAHGPTLPPDPWAGSKSLVAHGPTLPPDPWAGSNSLTLAVLG